MMLQFPLPSADAAPTLPSTELVSVTVLFASAVPLMMGVLSPVESSVLELPVSDAAFKSGVPGALGVPVSIVIARALEAEEVLLEASVAVAAMLWAPSVKALTVTDQFPEPSADALPTEPSTELVIATVLLASAVPVKVGVLSLVSLSVLELPVSVAALISGVEGALGGVESTTPVS